MAYGLDNIAEASTDVYGPLIEKRERSLRESAGEAMRADKHTAAAALSESESESDDDSAEASAAAAAAPPAAATPAPHGAADVAAAASPAGAAVAVHENAAATDEQSDSDGEDTIEDSDDPNAAAAAKLPLQFDLTWAMSSPFQDLRWGTTNSLPLSMQKRKGTSKRTEPEMIFVVAKKEKEADPELSFALCTPQMWEHAMSVGGAVGHIVALAFADGLSTRAPDDKMYLWSTFTPELHAEMRKRHSQPHVLLMLNRLLDYAEELYCSELTGEWQGQQVKVPSSMNGTGMSKALLQLQHHMCKQHQVTKSAPQVAAEIARGCPLRMLSVLSTCGSIVLCILRYLIAGLASSTVRNGSCMLPPFMSCI